MREKGFTLIELMVVIVIIAILAAVALPNFMGATEKARESAVRSAVKTIQTSLEMYATDNQGYYPTATQFTSTAFKSYLPGREFPKNPSTNQPYAFGNPSGNSVLSNENAYRIRYDSDGTTYTITGFAKDNTKTVIQVSSQGTTQ
ncbi:MAG: type II secretion system GspH family protein [Dictyoglomus sp.]|nr:type II secretion system GspH family protein [Dictyoglomus sp.]MDW8187708.1 type II secretion system protein [Dictyoglomus sp.]